MDDVRGQAILTSAYVKGNSACSEVVREAAVDAYGRLIFPSIEREIRAELTEKACDNAIKVFSVNLRQLLMQPPVKGRVTIGLDPGYRTGCKVAVVDATGKVLDTGVIYPTHSEARVREAKQTLVRLIKKYGVTLIAIGNGTASKETEIFTDETLRENHLDIDYMVVSEAGASVYSASKLAAAEYPEYDLTLRSAVSIAHRLQDPLAELVKIDPKAIGVGQYQHDMPAKRLDEALGGVVEACVNAVGVDLNTASPSLLENIAGISSAVAKNIVAYRQENGAFTTRTQIKKVPKLGPKAFEQCAGFLRVSGSSEILDSTQGLPESAYLKQVTKTGSEELRIEFKNGEIYAVNGEVFEDKIAAIQKVEEIGAAYGIGRDMHVGDTIIGIKGRVGFEAAAPMLIIGAHRFLEKYTLSKWQQYWKDQVANWYGMFLHESQYLEPVMRDIEAMLQESQRNVNGTVILELRPLSFSTVGVDSKDDLVKTKFGEYGEMQKGWTAEDAKGFIKVTSTPLRVYYNNHKNEEI